MEINCADLQRIYCEAPRLASKLDRAYLQESKTRQFPFVIAVDIPQDKSNQPNPNNFNQNSNSPDQSVVANDAMMLTLVKDALLEKTTVFKDESVDDITKQRKRTYYVFHDLEHFLNLRHYYPHAHEVVRCPISTERDPLGNKIYLDENSRGRLLFDIDLLEPLPEMAWLFANGASANMKDLTTENFVPPDFRYVFECIIRQTFMNYYVSVDVSKFIFIWQNSHSTSKLSLHLIVKNAFFSEHWTKQMRVFYTLFQRTAIKYGKSNYLKAIDFAMARRNATFRMLGSSKPGGNILEIEHCNYQGIDLLDYPQSGQITIYDCLVGVYHHEQLLQEQLIELDHLNFNRIEGELAEIRSIGKETPEEKEFRKTIGRQFPSLNEEAAPVNVNDEDIGRAVTIFQNWNQEVFSIRDQRGSVINLNRRRRAECPLSGRIHESENAYLKLRADGQMVFGCYRGCKNAHGHYYLSLGVYKPMEIHQETGQEVSKMRRNQGIVPINMSKIRLVQTVSTHMSDINPITGKVYVPAPPEKKKSSGSRKKKALKTSAKRITMSTDIVYIPNSIRELLSKSGGKQTVN